MGKVDQGFVALWVAAHIFQRPLTYIGFGGTGKQVRDVLHVGDLSDLVRLFLANLSHHTGRVFNAGGGASCSVSLRELTDLCVQATGVRVPISSVAETRPADVRWYVTDSGLVRAETGWAPKRTMRDIVDDVARWITDNRSQLAPILGG
jgi:CDP-paratose 2-epimerase